MVLRVTRLLVEALGNENAQLRVTRQAVEVLVGAGTNINETASNSLSLSQNVNTTKNGNGSNSLTLNQNVSTLLESPGATTIRHWPRWIFASASKHFVNSLTCPEFKIFVEGTDRNTEDLGQAHVEFRMDGPRIRLLHKKEHKVWFAINILYKVSMDDEDFHRKHDIVGKIVQAFVDFLPLFRYGDGANDDSGKFGCAILRDRPTGVQVNHFGQIDKDIRVEQGTVEGHYVAYLTET